MSYIQTKRMPHAQWKPEEDTSDRTIDARATAQKIGKTLIGVPKTAWALGALLIGAVSAGAAYALRSSPAPRRKTRGRKPAAHRRAVAA